MLRSINSNKFQRKQSIFKFQFTNLSRFLSPPLRVSRPSMASPAAKCLAADSKQCCSFSSPPVERHPLLTSEFVFYLSAFSVILLLLVGSLLARRFLKALELEVKLQSETGDWKLAYLSDLNVRLSNLRREIERDKKGNSTQVSKPLLLQVLPEAPSDSPEWDAFAASVRKAMGVGDGDGDEEGDGKRKKKKKKKGNLLDLKAEDEAMGLKNDMDGPVSVIPFTSSSSLIQRKIKQQYDQLFKSHESKNLTLVQVAEFVNCLSEVRLELKQKSETLQRKLTITKALLLKADRSSLGRHSRQLNKLDLEHKRLKEDTAVFNLIQNKFKQSQAYKKVLEAGESSLEKEARSRESEHTEGSETYLSDISFEELLEQEKKDSFWKKRGK